jgi:hypothetical protein
MVGDLFQQTIIVPFCQAGLKTVLESTEMTFGSIKLLFRSPKMFFGLSKTGNVFATFSTQTAKLFADN